MTFQYITYDKPEDGVGRITLNRPDSLNALGIAMAEEIYVAAEEAAEDPGVVVLIYRGAGRAFCVGRDFKESAELQTRDPAGAFAWMRRWKGTGSQTWLYPKATIAQVHGHAVGAGHNLAVACDITIAADNARFGFPEVRFGQLLGTEVMWNWLMGPKQTKEYLFTGRNFPAEEALRMGLVNKVVPAAELESFTLAMAHDIVAIERGHPGYIQITKAQINAHNLDLANRTTINAQVLEHAVLEADYARRAAAQQEQFFARVAEQGLGAALDRMHSGYSSKE